MSSYRVYSAIGASRMMSGGLKSGTMPACFSALVIRAASGCAIATWPPRSGVGLGVTSAKPCRQLVGC
jgi:hypothetical protein